jgi:hypothetical protein
VANPKEKSETKLDLPPENGSSFMLDWRNKKGGIDEGRRPKAGH